MKTFGQISTKVRGLRKLHAPSTTSLQLQQQQPIHWSTIEPDLTVWLSSTSWYAHARHRCKLISVWEASLSHCFPKLASIDLETSLGTSLRVLVARKLMKVGHRLVKLCLKHRSTRSQLRLARIVACLISLLSFAAVLSLSQLMSIWSLQSTYQKLELFVLLTHLW
jgi:hypothetical protein